MQIAICDDEQVFREWLKKELILYKQETRVSMDIYEYAEGMSFLADKRPFDIVFMDYQMPGINGLDVARTIRATNTICSIIFITSYKHFVLDAFEVSPYRFFMKPVDPAKLRSAINLYIKRERSLCPVIVNEFGEQRTIPAQDIVYIEGDGKYCNIRTISGSHHSSKTLGQMQKLLPQFCFYRIHKSYIINLNCILSIQDDVITLTNHEKAVISKLRKTNFKTAYGSFLENYYLRA